MSQVLGCGKRKAFSKGCGNREAVSSRRPRVWEACGQARRAGAPLGSCGKREAFSTGTGSSPWAFHARSIPAPEGLALEIRESAGFGTPYLKRNYKRFLTTSYIYRYTPRKLHRNPTNVAQKPASTPCERCTKTRIDVAQKPVEIPPNPQPGILDGSTPDPFRNVAQKPDCQELP